MDRDIYRFRDHFNIECFVNTCPSANLSWEWSPCKTPGPCAKKYHELTESEQNTEGITEYEELLDGCRVTNILSGRVMQPGYYRCTTVNDKGRDSAEIGLFVTSRIIIFRILISFKIAKP